MSELMYENAFDIVTDDYFKVATYKARSEMMNAVVSEITRNGWTQEEAAEKLNVSQPRISNLKNGRMSKFSFEELMRMLSVLGFSFKFDYQLEYKSKMVIYKAEAKALGL